MMAKRIFDIVVAVLMLILLAPLMLLIAILIWLTLGRPVLYKQIRPGLGGTPFELTKFRTMLDGTAADADRLTGVGRFLRGSSLDELPELVNVIRGDMSLVGPRPLLMEYLPLYTEEQNRRHEVRPGITGWAQVNGRNALSWDKRFEYDVYYVDHISFSLDVRIFFMTIWNILTGKGISGEGTVTMKKFSGNNT